MKKTFHTVAFILFLIITQIAFGQTDKDKALEKARTAVKIMDEGKIDESIQMLEEACKLDPNRFDYPYEIAYANYLKKDYKEVIKILEKNKNHKDVTERLYQLLGNSYDILEDSTKAIEIYDSGLKKFPNSGILYLEKGNVYWGKEEYEKALPFYEKGIKVNPTFPSNYYRATLLYCNSTESVWGMIYGEIFMNLERSTDRTTEISKLLYDTYKKNISITSDTSYAVNFSKTIMLSLSDLQNKKNSTKLYGVAVYEPTLLMSLINEKTIDLNSLDRIRTNFVDLYYKNGNQKKYPNVLFDYQLKVQKAGHLEAYNHWALMGGDEKAIQDWYNDNTDKWNSFIKWFTENPIEINSSNKFYSGQY